MAQAADAKFDTSKLSEENVRNFNKEDRNDPKEGENKKWVSCEIET